MGKDLNLRHDTRNASSGGFIAEGKIVAFSPSQTGLGIFNYIGTNLGRTTYSNPCYTTTNLYDDVTLANSYLKSIRVWGAGGDNQTVWTSTTGLTSSISGDPVWDFCKGFNAGTTNNGNIVPLCFGVNPTHLMLKVFNAGYNITPIVKVWGSTNGAKWDVLLNFSAAATTYVNGSWLILALSSKKYYRFIKAEISPANGATTSGFIKIDFAGKLKFLS